MIPDASPAQPMAPAAKQQQPTQQPVQESFMEETGEVQVATGGFLRRYDHPRALPGPSCGGRYYRAETFQRW